MRENFTGEGRVRASQTNEETAYYFSAFNRALRRDL